MSLPSFHNTNITRIHNFYDRLTTNLNALNTLETTKNINGYLRFTMDKLSRVRGNLLRTDDNWKSWMFYELIKALKKWTKRNPLPSHCEQQETLKKNPNKERLLQISKKQKNKFIHISL